MSANRTEYLVCASGCDDETPVIVSLTPTEAAVVQRIADLTQRRSKNNCMAVLTIVSVKEAEQGNTGYGNKFTLKTARELEAEDTTP